MGLHSSQSQHQEVHNLPKNLLVQLAFPKVGQKFQKAEFFYKTRQMKIHIPLDHQNHIQELKNNLELLREDDMQYYILLPKSYQFQTLSYCGNSGVAKIIYDYFPYSLEGQIENRKKSIDNEQFSEPEIWKILFTLLKAAFFMHKNWKKVGDIRPNNIFYNQQKQLRVSCQYSYPQQLTNFYKFLYEKEKTYLAPQQLQDIKMGRLETNSSRNAKQHIIEAESWSIGLTLLHVTLLFNFQKIYDPTKSEINNALLLQKIADLQNKKNLSEALRNIIKSMLEQIPERRLLSSELISNYLTPYEEQIKKLEPFDTKKLNQEIKELMRKKSQNSLVGLIWKACNTGLIQSLVINRKENEGTDAQIRAKETLMQQLQKFSEIPPKNSQVSIRQSIRLGRSRTKMTESNVHIQRSQVSNQSFHTVGSLKFSKKSTNINKIVGFGIENRFVTQRFQTTGENSPPNMKNLDDVSDKFMTPLQQSSYFQTIRQNERSFDFNSLGLLNSTFRNSQTIEDKNFVEKVCDTANEPEKLSVKGNFKKQKSKEKK